jgi:hypothetical protein
MPLEPNLGMIRLANRQASQTKLDIQILHLPGERIPLEDEGWSTWRWPTSPRFRSPGRTVGGAPRFRNYDRLSPNV